MDHGSGVLLATDLLFVGRIPSLDGSLRGWLRELQVLRESGAERVVPGHGPLDAAWPESADALQRYLTVLLEETRAAIARGTPLDEAVGSVAASERGRWLLFDDYNARNVTEAYQELQWE